MRLSEVCIDRPVFTTVMSLVILIFGAIALTRLQNRELPDIDPPIVSVTTVYPGAAAEVVETSLTEPLEDAVNGIPGVKHVTSSSREQVSSITVEFGLDRDIEDAANDVRDRVSRARSALPDEVDEPIVSKRDSDARPILWMALSGAAYDQIQLTQIAQTQLEDRLAKLPGVSNVIIAGERRFSMRVWIDNRQLGARNLSIAEVVAALQRENVDIPSGRVESADTEFTVRSLGELRSVTEFENLIISSVDSKPVRLSDVAEIERGPEDERKLVRFNGVPGIGLGIVKQSKANTLDVARAVRTEVARIIDELALREPGLKFEVAFDSASFIRESIDDVSRTIFEAILLVVLVIYAFLRSARATVIPAVAIPVSIIGAFAFLYFAGFTINTLTLMGVTLAIGLVVDDAIVVLENITRWVESGTPRMEAARRGIKEISFAVMAATISAVAVFLPLTFLTDTTGKLFREFAVTVAAAVAISGFVALTLSPMLCARVLRQTADEHGVKLFLARAFDRLAAGYTRLLRPVLERPALMLGVIGLGLLWVGMGVLLYFQIDQQLVPDSDRGAMFVWTEAPEGSTVEYMDRYQRQAEQLLLDVPEVNRIFSVVGLGFGTPGVANQGILFNQLRPRSERDRSQTEVVESLRDQLGTIPGISAFPINPNPLRGWRADPVEIAVQGPDVFELVRIADEIQRKAEDMGGFMSIRSDLVLNKPQLEVAIDRERAADLGMSVREISTTLQILLGGVDVSTFKLEGETYNVIAQLRRSARSNPRSLLELFVRGHGGLIPLAAVVDARQTITPRGLPHYDRFRAVTINAGLEDGVSQDVGLERMYGIAQKTLPVEGGYRVAFTGEAEKFFESSNALIFAYLLAIVIVYLVLAAQFESFFYPIVIMVAVFLSFTGALIALMLADALGRPGMTLNLFSKIGIVMLVGIVTKNSILIVEFANQLRGRGMELIEGTFEAARTRFRPILMTALATIAGIFPIALGIGAGGESRAPLGVAVAGGMLFATILTFFVVPATYVGLERLRESLRGRMGRSAPAADAGASPGAPEAAVAGGS